MGGNFWVLGLDANVGIDGSHATTSGDKGQSYKTPTGVGKLKGKVVWVIKFKIDRDRARANGEANGDEVRWMRRGCPYIHCLMLGMHGLALSEHLVVLSLGRCSVDDL